MPRAAGFAAGDCNKPHSKVAAALGAVPPGSDRGFLENVGRVIGRQAQAPENSEGGVDSQLQVRSEGIFVVLHSHAHVPPHARYRRLRGHHHLVDPSASRKGNAGPTEPRAAVATELAWASLWRADGSRAVGQVILVLARSPWALWHVLSEAPTPAMHDVRCAFRGGR